LNQIALEINQEHLMDHCFNREPETIPMNSSHLVLGYHILPRRY